MLSLEVSMHTPSRRYGIVLLGSLLSACVGGGGGGTDGNSGSSASSSVPGTPGNVSATAGNGSASIALYLILGND